MVNLLERAEIIAEIADISHELDNLSMAGLRTTLYFIQIRTQYLRLIEMKKLLGIDPSPEIKGITLCNARIRPLV